MKLITLNIWGGHVKDPLLEFIASHRGVDVFCLQEVYHNAKNKVSSDERRVHLNIFSELHALLPNHQAFFRPIVENNYGIGMFVKKEIEVLEEGDIAIYENPNYTGTGPAHSRNLQWIKCHDHCIINVHGLWNGRGKTDTPERIAQSQRIKNFMDALDVPKILCGDFNLRPDTASIKIFEEGMHNLVKVHGVTSTRTSFYPKEEKFADYIFTSSEIVVDTFETLSNEVSDHSPLFLEYKLEIL